MTAAAVKATAKRKADRQKKVDESKGRKAAKAEAKKGSPKKTVKGTTKPRTAAKKKKTK